MSEVVLTTHTTSAFKPGRHLSGREMQQAPPFSPKEPIFGPILPLTLETGNLLTCMVNPTQITAAPGFRLFTTGQ